MVIIRWSIVVLFVLLTSADARADWKYFQSEHFELYTDGKKGNAEEVLNHLEQVRDLFSRFSESDFDEDRPVRVIAFNSASAFKKVYGRRGRESAYAFYTESRDRNYIVFQELTTNRMFEVAVHEYVHLRTREMGLVYPVWLSEGFAEFYSTVRPQGSSVRVGTVPANVHAAGAGDRLPLKDLLTATRGDAKFWKSRTKVIGLYTKGWALTSMLNLHPEYRERSAEFLLAVAAGESGEDAFREVYEKSLKQVDSDLDDYTNGLTLPVLNFQTSWDREKHDLEPTTVSAVQEQLMMADILSRTGQSDEARMRYESLLEENPDDPAVHAGLARLAPDDELARSEYARASELNSADPLLYLDYARRLYRDGEEYQEAAAQALDKVSELVPDNPDPHVLRAALASRDGDHGRVLLHLRRASNIEPIGDYARLVWMAQAAREMGSTLQSHIAAGQAAAHVRTERQLNEVAALLAGPESPKEMSLAEIDALVESGELDSAAAGLLALQKRYPQAVPVYERFAEVQKRRGDVAREAVTQAAAIRIRRAGTVEQRRYQTQTLRRMALLDAAGLYEVSQRFFHVMTDLRPDDWVLFNNRAYELAQQEVLTDEAALLAERAVELVPDERSAAMVQDTLAWVYVKAKRTAEAIEIFASLVDEDPKSAIYQFHYGVALAQGGRQAEAVEAFDKALRSKTISERFRTEIEEARNSVQDGAV